jgi:hypothetical protein
MTKDQVIDKLFSLLDENNISVEKRPATLFELINSLGLSQLELKISLLVDCLYKSTRLGVVCWTKVTSDSETPTLKRGVLNQIAVALIKLHVDFAKLPGCGTYTPALFKLSRPTYPSKTHLEGSVPPVSIPMLDVEVKSSPAPDSDTESELDNDEALDPQTSFFQL